MRMILADADTWQGLYIDGVLVYQDHTLDLMDFAKIIMDYDSKITSVDRKFVDLDWLDEVGNMPLNLSDVKFI